MVEYKIAVDLGGTYIRAALFKGSKIIKLHKTETQAKKGKSFVIKNLVNAIKEVKQNKKIKGIGIGSPGPISHGIIKNPPNLPFKTLNLQKTIQSKFKIKTIVENDANCAALAEARLGVKKKNIALLTLGTGIGAGIIINNELYTGSGYASEAGHMIIQDGKELEVLAGGKSIKKITKKYFKKEIEAHDLLKINSKKAKEIINNEIKYLSMGIANLATILDPDVIIIAGGMRDLGNNFLNKVRKQVQKYTILPKKINIQFSKLKEPGLLGASLLIK
ncbi:MAG: ROK family protein [Nanoarchaeota archaeon]